MISLLLATFFILGLIIGSFLNVVILRFNTQRSLGGRSGCMTCESTLRWYELIPVFSFLGLGGRCRNCKSKISLQYPLVELASGIIFVLLFLEFQDFFLINPKVFFAIFIYYAFAFSLLLVIATYDLRHKIIPDSLSLIFGILAFAGLFFFDISSGQSLSSNAPIFYAHLPSWDSFLSGIYIALPFAFFWFVSSGRWMGLGDAKLSLGIGWLLGLPLALSSLVVAFWSGAVWGIALIIFSRNSKKG